ncbi:6-carboxytetrahydropterin synthase QueD [Synergistaceae bacterium OttesenSCG-928-D05]|nr:6-carboxytetrahydropterin synthase QueD [Synergistaceae bacterium OttesenSCG-928-D05]
MLLCREFKFDAAHNLINYHGKCERLHGHTYKMSVTLSGTPDHEGMIYDFVDLKKKVNDLVLSQLDHAYINDIIEQPTAEYIAQWIFRQLDAELKRDNCELFEVRVWETETSSVICRREDL